MNYANEKRRQLVRTFFDLQRADVPVSIRSYASHVGVKYYTFRDWYRDYKASAEYRNISTKEYSAKRTAKNIKGDSDFSFIRICRIYIVCIACIRISLVFLQHNM